MIAIGSANTTARSKAMIKAYTGNWISEVRHTITATVKQTTNKAPNHQPGIFKTREMECQVV